MTKLEKLKNLAIFLEGMNLLDEMDETYEETKEVVQPGR